MNIFEFVGEHPALTFLLVWLTYEFIISMAETIMGSKNRDGEQ